MRATLPCLLLLAACEPRPDFVSSHGVAFHLNGVLGSGFTPKSTSDMEDAWMEVMVARGGFSREHLERALARVTVELHPTLRCPVVFPDGHQGVIDCDGADYSHGWGPITPSDTLQLRDDGQRSPQRSAYPHELLHAMQWQIRGEVDYQHAGPMWPVIGLFQSVGRVEGFQTSL